MRHRRALPIDLAKNAPVAQLDRALDYESRGQEFEISSGAPFHARARWVVQEPQRIKAARSQYDVWLDIVFRAQWRNPEDVKASYPKASILKASRVVFNIKGNDYRLVAALQYRAGAVAIRFFGTHSEYDRIDAETV